MTAGSAASRRVLGWTPVAPLPASSPTRPTGITGRMSAPPETSSPGVCSFRLPLTARRQAPRNGASILDSAREIGNSRRTGAGRHGQHEYGRERNDQPPHDVVARIVTGPHDANRQDSHLPMRYDTGRPRAVIRLRISQPRTTSLPCPAGLRARRPSPMMDLYRKNAFSTRP